jgi:hypothetical protein
MDLAQRTTEMDDEMKKQKSLRQLKSQCWKLFSEYIRRKHADEGGTVECISCGKLLHWKDSQAGHFIGGRTNAVLFDEDIVYPQCRTCNIFKNGNYAAYTIAMLDLKGRTWVDEKLAQKHQTVKFTRSDLQEKIDDLKVKLGQL